MRLESVIKKVMYGKIPGLSGSFPYFGTKVYFPPNSMIFDLACEQGIYEAHNSLLIRSLVKPDSFFLDIGANIGLMAIPALEKCNSCKVVSFEPSPKTFKYLERTVQQSQYKDRWIIIDKALGTLSGEIDFFVASVDQGAFDGFKNTSRSHDNMKKISVPVITLDRQWVDLGKPAISVIKIDVEGAELDVLNGGLSCIKETQPYILLEWSELNLNSYNRDAADLLVFSREHQYRLYSTPSLVSIDDTAMLKLHMKRTESFLLEPC